MHKGATDRPYAQYPVSVISGHSAQQEMSPKLVVYTFPVQQFPLPPPS